MKGSVGKGVGRFWSGMKEGCTSSAIVTSPSCCVPEPKKHRDWRCLAEQVGLHENDLSCINSEKRLRIVFNEWDKRECVTVAKVYQVLVESQCTRAAECLRLAAQSMVEQEQREDILDLGGTCNC